MFMEIKIYSVLAPQWMNIKSLLKKFGVEFIHEKTFRDLGSGFDGLLAQLVERTTLNR